MAWSFRFAAVAAAALLPAIAGIAPALAADAENAGLFSLQLDYLIWNVSGDKLPPLVSTGVLSTPGTQILYGNSTVDEDWRSGGQITLGYRFDPQHNAGVELSFFDLADASNRFGADSNAYPTLVLPFIDATMGLPDSLRVGSPGLFSGAVTASDTSRLLGLRALYRREVGAMGKEHFSALIGYRFLYESDQLDIGSVLTSLSPMSGIPAGTVIGERDGFGATNSFHGLDLGIGGDIAEGLWHIEWRTQLALGANINGANIDGATAGITSSASGLYALSSNIGGRSQTRFGAVPEFSLNAGYEVAPSWRLVAGYDLIYWSGVQRAGALIDTTVNPNLLPGGSGVGPARPAARFDTSSLLAQGFTLGVKHDF